MLHIFQYMEDYKVQYSTWFLSKTSTVEDARSLTEVEGEVSEGETVRALADGSETLRTSRGGADLSVTSAWQRFQTSESKYQSRGSTGID